MAGKRYWLAKYLAVISLIPVKDGVRPSG